MLSPTIGRAWARYSRANVPFRHVPIPPAGLTVSLDSPHPKRMEFPLMFRVDAGKTAKYCDGISRRSFLQVGMAGLASLGLADVLRARAATAGLTGERRDTSVILLWLDGGPSHMD